MTPAPRPGLSVSMQSASMSPMACPSISTALSPSTSISIQLRVYVPFPSAAFVTLGLHAPQPLSLYLCGPGHTRPLTLSFPRPLCLYTAQPICPLGLSIPLSLCPLASPTFSISSPSTTVSMSFSLYPPWLYVSLCLSASMPLSLSVPPHLLVTVSDTCCISVPETLCPSTSLSLYLYAPLFL